MALVERTASYLEGPGRAEAKRLGAPANVLYASESMRLTTRLLDLASWLLIRRALKEGEISETEAQKNAPASPYMAPRSPLTSRATTCYPRACATSIAESYALHDRIVRLDRALSVRLEEGSAEPMLANPVGMQMDRLRVAFSS